MKNANSMKERESKKKHVCEKEELKECNGIGFIGCARKRERDMETYVSGSFIDEERCVDLCERERE